MTKSRNNYTKTIEAFKEWRKQREMHNVIHLFDKYKHDSGIELTIEDYVLMRDFLITEMTIPNGIRPGVISGVIIREVNEAKDVITDERYHKLMISSHKTGYQQASTVFVYPEIFTVLRIFVKKILKRLAHYNQYPRHLSSHSHIFHTFWTSYPFSKSYTLLRNHLSNLVFPKMCSLWMRKRIILRLFSVYWYIRYAQRHQLVREV